MMVYVSDRFPPKNNTWTKLGHFQAHNSKNAQVFPVLDSKIWAKYIKIDFITYYGKEFYCPLTTLKVYGATQMEKFRKEEEEEEFLETATLTVDAPVAIVGTKVYDYPFRLPYREKHQQQQQQQYLGVGPVTSSAKAYLRDIQGLVGEYNTGEEGGAPAMPTAAAVHIPKVPNLPWDHANRAKETGQDTADNNEQDEGEGEDDEIYEECGEDDE
ncbi:hypothetical protein GGI12_005317, partial [Dipsacomyces acuminosporus]